MNKKLIVALTLFALVITAQAGSVYVSNSFTGSDAGDWTFTAGQGSAPTLTAAQGIDADGDGWLRLAKDAANQSTFAYCNTAIPTNQGLVFTFDFVIWGAKSAGDGFALAIFDAATTPAAGGYGGSLGYSKRWTTPGLAGGIVGFGFDVHGNYSNPTEGREGGPGMIKNSVAIRGSMGENRNDGYEYITGIGDLEKFATANASSRAAAVIHTTRITITTDKLVTIEWKTLGGEWEPLINKYQCDLNCPDFIKFGYTAGTGGVSSNHEIRNLSVTSVPEPASMIIMGFGLVGLLSKKRIALRK